MSEQKALGIQLIRECILSHIADRKDLFNVSKLNRDFCVDARKQLESRQMIIGAIINQQLLEYTEKIKEPIICGRNMTVFYITNEKVYIHKKDKNATNKVNKFTKAQRAKVLRRLPLLEPRIFRLHVEMGESMTAKELVSLFKSSRNAKWINWNIGKYGNKEKLFKILHKVKNLMEDDNLSFPDAKTFCLSGKSEIEFNFWADEFMIYFPNIEKLNIADDYRYYDITNKFLRKLDDLGRLETLVDFSCSINLSKEIWNSFLRKPYSFTKVDLDIREWNISLFGLFLDKYQHQLQNLSLHLNAGFDEIVFPPMSKLTKLDLFWYSGDAFMDIDQLFIDDGKDAYPKLREINIEGWNLEKTMFWLRNISANIEVSTQMQKVTTSFIMNDDEFLELKESGKEAEILEELNKLFPNANNKINYDQMENPDYPNIQPNANRNVRRCVIS